MFIDRAKITVRAGDGGRGCSAFRREKFVPRGGPSGGDGGKGGDVVIECSDRVNTLLHFRYQREFRAGRGSHGQGSNRHGKGGKDITILVPPGTQVFREADLVLLADFAVPGQRLMVAAGGRGGRGNARFAGPTHQAPRRADPGRPGETLELSLNLKLIFPTRANRRSSRGSAPPGRRLPTTRSPPWFPISGSSPWMTSAPSWWRTSPG
jgi:GTP-binding protein